MCCPASVVAQLVRNGTAAATLQLTCASLVQSYPCFMRGNFRPGVQLTRTARSLRSGRAYLRESAYLPHLHRKSMGAPDAFSVNMRLRYASGGRLRWSGEAYFQAYLVLWVRRIDTTTHLYSYAAHLKMRRRNSFENLALYAYYIGVLPLQV